MIFWFSPLYLAPFLAAFTSSGLSFMYCFCTSISLCFAAKVLILEALHFDNLKISTKPFTDISANLLISKVRTLILSRYAAGRPHGFELVFTLNASHGLDLLSRNFSWEGEGSFLLYSYNSHTSVVGCRNNCTSKGGGLSPCLWKNCVTLKSIPL